MLAGAGLGQDARLAHALGEQRLAQGVVQFVGPGVQEILAFEPQVQAPLRAQALRVKKRRGPSTKVPQEAPEAFPKLGLGTGLYKSRLEFDQGRHEGLGSVAAAETAVVRIELEGTHGRADLPKARAPSRPKAARAAATKSAMSSASFSPGERSSLEEASTPKGAVAAT